ncbi:MAG TPA: SMC-Scp complex subunit ScpB [Dehalococcoidia bacterium]|nr:SMC-Scp complex subunit ScpB [Dehalococcoidia bacterium]
MNTEALDRLKLIVESVLFVADEPVEIGALARIAEAPLEDVQAAVDALAADCRGRGVRLQRTESAVQMVSAPEATPYVERYLGVEEDHRLSHASLETLAIIAYKQPITRQAIEAIRGVNCDRALASLRARGLITEVGRAATVGRPYLFGTTFRFLEHFGLEKPEDLPRLEEGGSGKEEEQ